MKTADFTNLQVAFRTFHGNYLRDSTGTYVNTWINIGGNNEKWTIIPLSQTDFAIRSCRKKYICAHGSNGGATISLSANIGSWERFKLINTDGNLWVIQSVEHGSYICTRESGNDKKVDMSKNLGNWEKYNIEVLSQPEIVHNLKYHFDKSQILSETSKIISTIQFENSSNIDPVKLKHTIDEQILNGSTFTQTNGTKVGSKTKLFAGIPGIFKENLGASFEMERIWTSGIEFVITSNIKLEIKIDVYPRKSVNVSLIALKRQMSIPWTAKATYNIENEGVTKDIGGV